MTQKSQKQLMVPFGKYKGKPVEMLLQDESYAKWLVGQDWFQQKFQSMYTLIIHNYHAEPVDTPEHNQMQVKFLNEKYCIKVAYLISNKTLFQYNSSHFAERVIPLIQNLKDNGVDLKELIGQLKGRGQTNLLRVSKVQFETGGIDVKYSVDYGYGHLGASDYMYYKYKSFFDNFWENTISYELKIELKPFVGDDFPSVLRQVKSNKSNALIVREYTGTGVSWEEVKSFFQSQRIKVVTEIEIEKTQLPEYEEKLSINPVLFEKI